MSDITVEDFWQEVDRAIKPTRAQYPERPNPTAMPCEDDFNPALKARWDATLKRFGLCPPSR